MAEKRRIDRLEQQLRIEIGTLVESALEDPRVGTVAVTEVRVSGDLRHARVYVSTLGDAKGRADTLEGLDSARGFLRRQLSQRLPHLRRTPELTFGYDESVETGMRVEELIEKINSSATMIQKVLETIQTRDDFVIASHVRPDGDSLGSQLALALSLRALGKKVTIISHDPVPSRYEALPASDQVQVADRLDRPFGAAFVLECGTLERPGIGGLDDQFVVNIDHHHSTEPFGAVNWIEPSACAVGEMIFRLSKALDVDLTPEIATNVYVAILTDTGSFQFDTTTAATFRLAAELAEHGADVSGLAMRIFYSNTLEKVRSMGVILNAMQLDESGRIVWTALTRDDMVRHGCMDEDVEGLVNYPLTIVGVDVALFFRELEDGSFRVSLRSKSELDVSQIAAGFGGGGHRKAAGCRLVGSLVDVQEQVVSRVRAQMNHNSPGDPSISPPSQTA